MAITFDTSFCSMEMSSESMFMEHAEAKNEQSLTVTYM